MTLVIPLSDVMHMELAVFYGIGFFAQLIDGALGMAFGGDFNHRVAKFWALTPSR